MKDFVITVSVLDRPRHRFIIRETGPDTAIAKAGLAVEAEDELSEREKELAVYHWCEFKDLETEGIFVCF